MEEFSQLQQQAESKVAALAARLRELVLTAEPPDRIVTVRLFGDGRAEVQLADDAFDGHTPESLARQISTTLTSAIAEVRKLHAKARRQYFGDDADEVAGAPPRTRAGRAR